MVDRARPGPVGLQGPIRLVGLKVAYPGRAEPVLDGVDLELAPGEHVAVTGESGSGKSTLLAVLLGFVGPVAGEVSVGGHRAARRARCELWRRQVSWVPQRPYLVRGTIADNIRLGDPGASDAELARAVEQLGPAGLVGTPSSSVWHTPVGEGGLTLSTGERQRIAIARAVLRDAPVSCSTSRRLISTPAARRPGRAPRPVAREPDRPRRRPPPAACVGRVDRISLSPAGPGPADVGWRRSRGRSGPGREPVAPGDGRLRPVGTLRTLLRIGAPARGRFSPLSAARGGRRR